MSHRTTPVPTDPTTWPVQLTLPGQSHTAEGPHDQTGMYVMHHGFRRDLDHFVAAVEHTPVSEADVWSALLDRWLKMAEVLHHHHGVEDEALWPVLAAYATSARGTPRTCACSRTWRPSTAVIDPALAAVRQAFEEMVAHPCDDHRNALDIRLTCARESLHEHLAHEEGQALPMLQRTLSVGENESSRRRPRRATRCGMVPFLLCWVMDGLPDEARERIVDTAPPGYGLLHRLLRGRYQRRERVAFRYV